MRFFTAINCMDGRVQIPVIQYLKDRFNVDYVDVITEPGPILILSEGKDARAVQSIRHRLNISIEKHNTMGLAVVGHHDCAGNPASKAEQVEQIQRSIAAISDQYEDIHIIGLWVDENWEVEMVNG